MGQAVAWSILVGPSKRRWIVKHAAGVCGVNAVLFKWKRNEKDECPRFGLIETSNHVWRCQSAEALAVWEKSIETLEKWMSDQGSAPTIIAAIGPGLRNWQKGATSSISNHLVTQYQI